MDRPYSLGDEELHIAFKTYGFDTAHKTIRIWIVCFKNEALGNLFY
ncbi:MAG: hypothetical protein GY760_02665 [Deltaproteobacteria bacterium]|nr:hypothetical protein [Deltaproteobacteria bacterium]